MATSKKFFKIGLKAHLFYCASTGLKVTSHKPGELAEGVKLSTKIGQATGNGHIIEIQEEEYTQLMAAYEAKANGAESEDAKSEPETDNTKKLDQELVDKLKGMTKDELLAHVKDNFEIDTVKEAELTAMKVKALLGAVIKMEKDSLID